MTLLPVGFLVQCLSSNRYHGCAEPAWQAVENDCSGGWPTTVLIHLAGIIGTVLPDGWLGMNLSGHNKRL